MRTSTHRQPPAATASCRQQSPYLRRSATELPRIRQHLYAHTEMSPHLSSAEIPVGATTDLLFAFTNGGGKMFNISREALTSPSPAPR